MQLTFPPEPGQAARTIRASNLEAKGEAGKGLTRAQFTGNVQYRERLNDVGRAASAAGLDVTLKPGMTIERATFTRSVRFEEGAMTALVKPPSPNGVDRASRFYNGTSCLGLAALCSSARCR